MFINQDKINFFERKKEKTLKSIWKSIIQYNKTLSLSLFCSLSSKRRIESTYIYIPIFQIKQFESTEYQVTFTNVSRPDKRSRARKRREINDTTESFPSSRSSRLNNDSIETRAESHWTSSIISHRYLARQSPPTLRG